MQFLSEKSRGILIIFFICGALFLRLINLFFPLLDSDQAITGLMGMHILKGEFPVFFWGQAHCGVLESYIASVLFFFFGSSRFVLNMAPALVSGLFIYLFYRLVLAMFGMERAFYALGLMAITPFYLTWHSVLARACYIESLTLGVMILLLTFSLSYSKVSGKRYFFLLGFFSGISFWVHFFAIFYLIPASLFIWLKDKKIIFKKDFLLIIIGFFVGSLPFWIFNVQNDFASFYGRHLYYKSDFMDSLYQLFQFRIPTILGLKQDRISAGLIPYFSNFIYLLFLLSLIFAFWERRNGLKNILKGSLFGTNGMEMIIVFFVGFVLVFILSGVEGARRSRYVLPLSLVFMTTMAYFLVHVRNYSSTLSLLLFISLLFSNIYGNIALSTPFDLNKIKRYRAEWRNEMELFDFLKKNGIKFAYTPSHWDAYKLTFDSKEEIIFTEFFNSRNPEYLEMADASQNIAFVYHGGDSGFFDDNLNGIGAMYKKSQVGDFTIFYDFKKPHLKLEEIMPQGWSAKANYNNEDVNNAFDRDISTSWTSWTPQKPGMTYEVDFGRVYHNVSKIVLLQGTRIKIPQSYILEISNDGKKWDKVKEVRGYFWYFFWSGPRPFAKDREGRIEINFLPVDMRFLRLIQRGRGNESWSISEIFAYKVAEDSLEQNIAPDLVVEYIEKNKKGNIFTDYWLDVYIKNKRGNKAKKITAGPVDFSMDPVFIMEKGKGEIFKKSLSNVIGDGEYEETELGGFILFHSFKIKKEKDKKIEALSCSATSNYNQMETKYAVDGDIETMWSSTHYQVPGMYVQLDLCKAYTVSKIELRTGANIYDYPREIEIEISQDGENWEKINAWKRASLFYWSGTYLLKNQEKSIVYSFKPVSTRHIRIILSKKHPIFNWSISSIALFI